MKNVVLQLMVVAFLLGCDGNGPSINGSGPGISPGSGSDLPLHSSGEIVLDVSQPAFDLEEGQDTAHQLHIEVGKVDQSGPEIQLELLSENANQLRQIDYWFDTFVQTATGFTTTLNIRLAVAMAPVAEHSRTIYLVASDGVGRTETRLDIGVKPVSAPDIYLLIGQSNMEGLSEPDAKDATVGGADEPHPRIRQLNVQSSSLEKYPNAADYTNEESNTSQPVFITAEDPLHRPRGENETAKSGTSVGIGLAFAKAALVDTTQQIYLVPAAWSGSAFCANANGDTGWNARQPTDSSLRGGLLVERALTRLNMTLRETNGIFRGILWHQGESDSNNDTCADLYAENLQLLISRIRREARVDMRGASARGDTAAIPLVLGTMSMGDDERGEFSFFSPSKSKVDLVHRSISNLIPYADFSNNDDLKPPAYPCGKDSCIHFGAAANREQGYRLYQALKRVQSSQ